MDENESRRGVLDGGPEDLARMRDALVEAAERNFLYSQQAVAGVEEHGAQRLAVEEAHFRAKQFLHEPRLVEWLARNPLARQADGEAEGRAELERLGGTDSFHGGELRDGRAGDAITSPKPGEQLAGDINRVRPLAARAQEDGDELRVAERLCPAAKETLAGTLVFGKFADASGRGGVASVVIGHGRIEASVGHE